MTRAVFKPHSSCPGN